MTVLASTSHEDEWLLFAADNALALLVTGEVLLTGQLGCNFVVNPVVPAGARINTEQVTNAVTFAPAFPRGALSWSARFVPISLERAARTTASHLSAHGFLVFQVPAGHSVNLRSILSPSLDFGDCAGN
jgi:hypothetical protein